MENKKSIYIICLIIPLLLLSWGVTYILASGPLIGDESFEDAIRSEFGIEHGEIRPDQINQIEELQLRNAGIKSIEGIEHFTSLTSLDLRDNQIEDISPVGELSNLTALNFRGNHIQDISALNELTRLTNLNLRENRISDISSLADLSQLEDVNLRYNDITDITPLQHSVHLRERLYITEGNDIHDYSPVRDYISDINDTDIDYDESLSLAAPEFSHTSGFYEADFDIELSYHNPDKTIYYTLDGSEPNPHINPDNTMKYEEPVRITDRSGDANVIADIPTNNIKDGSRVWFQPPEDIPKATVVRAVVMDENNQFSSDVAIASYFINKDHALPVVSLNTDKENLFSDERGIYVPGNSYDPQHEEPDETGNYEQRGREWERPVHIQFFDENGESVLDQNAGVRMHGGFTRRFPQKTLRLYARNDYGNNMFSYPVFNNERLEFKRLLLRQSGNDWGRTLFNDAMMQELIAHEDVEMQSYQPAAVYLNGEYWGIHNFRERFDQHYFETLYDIDRENLIILERDGEVHTGQSGDEQHYLDMLQFIEDNDMSQDENYEYVQTLMDTDNFITYQLSQIYYRNTDWPNNNNRFYRKITDYNPDASAPYDGRWRWLLYDTDHGFAFNGSDAYEHNTLAHATEDGEWSTFLLRELLENEAFREQFLSDFASHLNTSFDSARVLNIIHDMKNGIKDEMENHIHRWGSPDSIEDWKERVEDMETFAEKRPDIMREHLVDHFGLEGTAGLTVENDFLSEGTISINGIEIEEATPGIDNPDNWTGQYFQGIPVTVTAVPEAGYEFAGWGEDIDSDSATIEIVLDGDLTLEPEFN